MPRRKKKLPEKVKVIFRSTEGVGGKDDIFIGLNGQSFLIKRDEPVEVPRALLNVIDDAIMTIYEQTESGLSKPRDIPRFPYEIVPEEVPEEEEEPKKATEVK